jgi:hypothetical protein
MKSFNGFKLAAVSMLACFSGSLMAAEFFLDAGESQAKGANSSVVLVGFSGNAEITDSQVDVNYDASLVSVSVKAFGNAGCSNPSPGLIRVVSPDLGGKSLGEKVGAYCQVTVRSLDKSRPVPGNALKLSNAFCSGTAGLQKSCSAVEELSAK